MTIQELRDKRLNVWGQAKALNDKVKAESRAFTSEEQVSWDKMNSDLDALAGQIKVEEQAEARAREFAGRVNPGVGRPNTADDAPEPTAERHTAAFYNWLRRGANGLDEAERQILGMSRDGRGSEITVRGSSFGHFTTREQRLAGVFEKRAQGVATGAAGAFTVPQGFMNAVEESLLAFGGMLQASFVLPTDSGNDLPWPTVNDNAVVGELLAENTAAAQADLNFSQIILKAYKYSSKEVVVSRELLEDNAVNLDQLLGRFLGTRIGRILNTHFTTGDNAAKPQGAATFAATGITTASATAIAADELFDVFHSLDPAYRVGPQVYWMFRDSTLKAIRKLKDTTNRYLFEPSMQVGVPDTLLGKPYIVNQDIAAIATGAKTVLFGDFSKYLIRDVTGFRFRRMEEIYGNKDQVSFITFKRYDGRVLDAGTDPIVRIIQL